MALRPDALAYLAGLFPDLGPVAVLDVGANPIEGDAPYKGLMAAGLAHVTGFEPQEGPLAALNARKSLAETYHPHALGAGGPADLHLYHHSGFTSLFKIDPAVAGMVGFAKSTRPAGKVAVETRRLDDLAEIGRVDFLKIDVQGAEQAIIAHGRSKLAQTVLIQTEVRFIPLYEGEPGFAGLDLELQAQGFRFHDFAFLKRASLRSASHGTLRPGLNRQVVDGDAFYLRDLTGIADWSVEQVQRLAVLAEAVVDSPNLCAFCLDQLVARKVLTADAVQGYFAKLPLQMMRAAK
mgnify:CR=1 FL=1